MKKIIKVDGVEYIFSSNSELSRQLGKYDSYVCTYRNKGMSYEEIIKKLLTK